MIILIVFMYLVRNECTGVVEYCTFKIDRIFTKSLMNSKNADANDYPEMNEQIIGQAFIIKPINSTCFNLDS